MFELKTLDVRQNTKNRKQFKTFGYKKLLKISIDIS